MYLKTAASAQAFIQPLLFLNTGSTINTPLKIIVKKFGQLFLKLESNFNVSNRCIDQIVDELQLISSSASAPVLIDVVESTLKSHNCDIDPTVISDLVKNLCESNPVSSALGKDGRFSTTYKRREFIKALFFLFLN